MGWYTAQWKMLLFCVKTIVKESCKFELAHLKKKKKKEERKKNILVIWRLSGSVLLRCFLAPLGMLFIMKTLEDEQQVVITAYKLAVFEILRVFLYKHILCVCAIPTYRVYQLYDMTL